MIFPSDGDAFKVLVTTGSGQSRFAVPPQARWGSAGALPCTAAEHRCGGGDKLSGLGAVPGLACGDSRAAQVKASSPRAACALTPPILLPLAALCPAEES